MPSTNLCSFGFFGTLAHGPVLKRKHSETGESELTVVVNAYSEFINHAQAIRFELNDINDTKSAIETLTSLLNAYRAIALPILEARENSGQENLRSSILEEFFQLLLFPLTESIRATHPTALALGKANSYVSLTFTPRCFSALFENPTPTVHTKDQDFVLGCAMTLSSSAKGQSSTAQSNSTDVVIPVIAIECKTYIERNMLDSCAGTAKRLKSAMPYCLYIVASEYMKMDDAYPELTDIDELFILTKKSNADRLRLRADGNPPPPQDM